MTRDGGFSAWTAADEAVTDWLGKAGSCLQVRTHKQKSVASLHALDSKPLALGTTPKPRPWAMPEQASQTQYGPLVARLLLEGA